MRVGKKKKKKLPRKDSRIRKIFSLTRKIKVLHNTIPTYRTTKKERERQSE